jgi:ribosomal silencing factor RsfS
LACLDDSKAEDIVAIDLHGKTILADVMIIATGRSNIHVGRSPNALSARSRPSAISHRAWPELF